MTGSPLLRLALVLGILAALLVPAVRLTGREKEPQRAAPTPVASGAAAKNVKLTFLSPITPTSIKVEADGKTVAELKAPTMETEVSLLFPKQGVDLVISAEWPQGSTENALRVQASTGEESLADTTLWGGLEVNDVVTLSSKP
jgi:hypothetical protein